MAATSQAPASLPPEAIALAGRMYDAARSGQNDILRQALTAGLPPNMTNEKGDTLIMLAAYHGHTETVRMLLSQGADPNRLNDRGQSPLAGAVFKMENEVIEALLDGGADPEYGEPNALACVAMFRQEERWKARFEAAPGKGKMRVQGNGSTTAAANGVANGEGHAPRTEGELEETYRNHHQ